MNADLTGVISMMPQNDGTAKRVTTLHQGYDEMIGQDDAVSRLKAFSDFHLKNCSTAGHVLIVGEEGTGRATIARVFARELGVPHQETDASSLQIKGDLTAILTNFRAGEAMVLREIQRLKRFFLEVLTPVLRTQRLEILLGSGPAARAHVMELKPFTLVATATKKSDCSPELLGCFSIVVPLQPYSVDSLVEIANRVASDTGLEIDSESAKLIAMNSGGRPHQVQLLMERVAKAVGHTRITLDDVRHAFGAFGINVPLHDDGLGGFEFAQMSGVGFEKLFAELLARMNFRAETTKATGDGGVDIVAVLDKPVVGGKYLFQCKRYAENSLVGASVVRDFYGAVTAERGAKGVLVSTSDFTSQAREFAERVGLELINFGQLKQLLKQYGMDGS